MSMSVGAASSSALSYLQSLLQQGTAGAGDAKKSSASDPLAMLMQAISGDGASPGQTSSAATSSNAATGSTCPQFSPDTMSALLSAQGQQSTGGPTNADGSTTTTISYADGSKVDMTTPAQSASAGAGNKNSANLLEQLIKLQSQVLNFATSTMSAVA